MARARLPACGDNLFAVIRTAKETIWRSRCISGPPVYPRHPKTPKHVLHARRSNSAPLRTRESLNAFSKSARKAKIPSSRTLWHPPPLPLIFFFRAVFARLNGTHRAETFHRNWDTFYGFRGTLRPSPNGWNLSRLVSVHVFSTFTFARVFINSFFLSSIVVEMYAMQEEYLLGGITCPLA